MTKLRSKMRYDFFEGNYFVVQKKVYFFWVDVSGWFTDPNRAIDYLIKLQEMEKSNKDFKI